MLRKVLLLVLAVTVLAACSKKEVKVQSEDSKLAVEAFSVTEDMRAAYVKKDFKALKDYMTAEGYGSVSRRLKDFEKAKLEFKNRWVEIDADRVVLNVSWEGTWTVGGKELTNRGMAVFELVGRPLKVNRIMRSSPFMNPE